MSRIRKITILFWSCVASIFIMSASFLLMPFSAEKGRLISVLIGLMFWIFAIVGYVLIGIASREQKHFFEMYKEKIKNPNRKPGIIMFFSNIPAVVADTAMICAVILLIITQFTKLKGTYFIYVMLFVLNFSLHMHCLFNGKIYLMTKIKSKRGEKAND